MSPDPPMRMRSRRGSRASKGQSRDNDAVTIRAYKLRLYPTRAQEHALARWFGYSRWVWNWGLEARRKAYRRRGETFTSVDLGKMLTRIKGSKARGCASARWPAQGAAGPGRDR